MGTRYEDQPPEHWAGPESLDPTPVWKQFLAVGLLALTALAIIAIVSLFALAPQLATPPALVPGDRLVLARAQLLGSLFERQALIRAPIVPDEEAVWIVALRDPRDVDRVQEYVSVKAMWTDPATGRTCRVTPDPAFDPGRVAALLAGDSPPAVAWRAADCAATFGVRGEPIDAARGLDRYLVSEQGDRVIVNLSRPIRGFGKTPQPTRSPL